MSPQRPTEPRIRGRRSPGARVRGWTPGKRLPGGAILLALLATGAALLTAPAPVSATETAAAKIPPNEWGCTLCHAGTGVTPELVPEVVADEMNDFGSQWRDLAAVEVDRLWSEMALANADGDGCSNGCEMSDPAGEYVAGGPYPVRNCSAGDPNVVDCSLPLDEESWSTLKSLFGEG